MYSIITPALLLSVGHDEGLGIDQPTSQAATCWVCTGNLPHDRLLRHVSAYFDDSAWFQDILCEPGSLELNNRGTFDGPAMSLSVRAFLVQEYKSVRIDLMKLDNGSPHAHGFRCVEICERMMSQQRTCCNDRHQGELSCLNLVRRSLCEELTGFSRTPSYKSLRAVAMI